MNKKCERYIKRLENLKSLRFNFDDYYEEAAEYFIPRKSYITRKQAGGERLKEDLFDSTGRRAVNVFAAGLFASLTPASSKWLNYQLAGAEEKDADIWLNNATNKTINIINQTNWSIQIQEFYRQIGIFGTASMLIERDAKRKLRFTCLPIEESYIAENEAGEVDTIYRPFEWTVEQAYRFFGEESSKCIKEKYQSGKYDEKIKLLHIIEPRYERKQGSKNARDKAYASVYISIDDKVIMREGGYDYFPCSTARLFKERRSAYGYGIAMLELPDMKELNKFHYITVRGGLKQVDPLLFTNDDGIMLPKNAAPGSLIKGSGEGSDLRPVVTGGRHDIGRDILEMKQQEIKEAFYYDLFRALAGQQGDKTAYEIQQRVAENKAMIAPLIMPILNEAIDPIMETVFSMLFESGEYGQLPQSIIDNATTSLDGEKVLDLRIEYTSSLAMAMKLEELGSIQDVMMFAGNIAQFKPSILDKIDEDYAMDRFAKLRGVDPKLIYDAEGVASIRQARAEREAQIAGMQAAQQQAEIAKTTSEAEKNVRQV